MKLEFKLKSAVLSGGTTISFAPEGVTAIVGPNNCGKSTFLREIQSAVATPAAQSRAARVVTSEIHFQRSGSVTELTEFLDSSTRKYTDSSGNEYLRALNVNIQQSGVAGHWVNEDVGMQGLAPLFCNLADTQQRLTIVNPPAPINLLAEPLVHPIHVLQDDDDVEARLCRDFRAAFGTDLILNRGAGSKLPLHMGRKPVVATGEDRVSKPYLRALAALPQIQNQGDGIKSFVGCLLATSVMKRQVTLVDEPEAFLHPPQALLLGTLLGKEAGSNQLIVATHSGDVLRGLLASNITSLQVIRITRKENKNYAHVLEHSQIARLWADPILRFSNVLEGLFHEGVILCESDTDCRFYAAIRDELIKKNPAEHWPDVHFASSGGKDRMPVIVKALAQLGVAIRCVTDFDMLAGEQKLSEVFSALGGDWDAISADYKELKSTLDKVTPPLSPVQVADKIRSVLADVETQDVWKSEHKDAIRIAMRATSAWSNAKAMGKAAIPAGQPTQRLENIMNALNGVGLWLVPTGEIESFDKTVGGHGVGWLVNVLQKEIGTATEFEPARAFVRGFCMLDSEMLSSNPTS